MYNSLDLASRSAIKDFSKTIGEISKVYELGTRHSSDLQKLLKIKSSDKKIDYIHFNKRRENLKPNYDLLVCVDTLCYLSPDWKDILSLWLKKCEYGIIINPMWMIGTCSLDFKSFGYDWYIKNVPIKSESYMKKWFQNHNSYDPKTLEFTENSYGVWQFGITEYELTKYIESLGYQVISNYYLGVCEKPWIHNKAYLVQKGKK